jgi:hypothetical protein
MTPLVRGIQVWLQAHGFLLNELLDLKTADESVWCEVHVRCMNSYCVPLVSVNKPAVVIENSSDTRQ